ncbi:MAG: RNA methyltransferase [Myxococcaceae bacterium]|nr:RNA methyltransferase [Myxococcaceae bacterium]
MSLPRLVLLRPRNADNLGAVARAMKNFGLTDWVVVSPNPNLLEAPGLNRLAVKAGELLEQVRLVATLEEAVKDCGWVVGTTMRTVEGRRRLAPREVVAQAPDAPWALVFGDERSGLTNEDLLQCHALSFIPTGDEQPSLNLAQAVLVYAYECFLHGKAPASGAPGPALASDEQLRALKGRLTAALEVGGFLREGQGSKAVDELQGSWFRARLTRHEASLWLAALGSLHKSALK